MRFNRMVHISEALDRAMGEMMSEWINFECDKQGHYPTPRDDQVIEIKFKNGKVLTQACFEYSGPEDWYFCDGETGECIDWEAVQSWRIAR